MEGRIREVVRAQHGVVGRAQLQEAGLTRGAVDARVEIGRLLVVHPGVYKLSPVPLSRPGTAMAAHLAIGTGSLISYRTAAALWELARWDNRLVHVTAATPRHQLGAGIRLHSARSLQPHDRGEIDGIPATAVPRTLIDCAMEQPIAATRRMVEEADRIGLLVLDDVWELLGRTRGHPGRRRLLGVIAAYDGAPPTRSELEDRFLDLMRRAEIGLPRINAIVAGWEVDMYWPGPRFAVELDGHAFHRTGAQARRDRLKEEALDRAGIVLRRFDWWQVTRDGDSVAAAVLRALRRKPG